MGLLGKYAAYRWVSAGRGGGDGDGGADLVIIFGIFAVIIGVLWAVSAIFSFAWNLTYSLVRPLLIVFPPVTVPVAVVLVGWAFTLIGPYPTEKTEAFLDGTGDKLSFAARSVWAVTAINGLFLIGHFETLPEPSGVVGIVLGLVVALVLLYGLYEFFHLPYRCIRLLLHAPGGTRYVVAFLSPIVFVILTGAFDVPINTPLAFPVSLDSEMAVTVGAFAVLNGTYLGGILAVLWKQDAIRDLGTSGDQDGNRGELGGDTTSTVEPTLNTD